MNLITAKWWSEKIKRNRCFLSSSGPDRRGRGFQGWGACTDTLTLCGELTNQGLPLAIGLGDLIDTAHLTVRHPSNYKDNDPGPRLDLGGAPVLVPVAIASTATWGNRDRNDYNTLAGKHSCDPMYRLECRRHPMTKKDRPWRSTGFGRHLSLGNVRVLLGVKFVLNGVLNKHMADSSAGITDSIMALLFRLIQMGLTG